MQQYLSICGETVTQKVIEKSRFITTSRHVEGEEQAKAFVEEIRGKYPDATHNCSVKEKNLPYEYGDN